MRILQLQIAEEMADLPLDPLVEKANRIIFIKGRIAALDAQAARHWEELIIGKPEPPNNFRTEMRVFEIGLLRRALSENKGNQTKSAKALGITRASFIYRCLHLGIFKISED